MDVIRWNQNFEEIQRYLVENNCKLEDVPKDVRVSNGTVMRIWIAEMRKAYQNLSSTNFHLNDEQKEKLRSIGMEEWINLPEQEWLSHLMDVKAFYEEHHHFSVPFDMKSGNIVLYNWIVKQRSDFKKDIMSEEHIQKIQEYGLMEMVAFRRTPFENGFYHAKMFYKEHHHLQVPENFQCEDGYPLGLWIDELQQKFSQNQLSATIIRKMNRIGMIWKSKSTESETNAPDEKFQNAKLNKAKFKKKFCYAKAFFQKHGHLFIPENFVCEDGYELGKWIYQLRQKYAQNRLFSEWIEALNEIGMVWTEEEYQFEWGFCHANQFYQENENLFVPENYICIDGYQLGKWICEIRNQFMQGNLSEEQIQKLNNIGIIWNIRTQDFEVGYYHAELFYQENQHLFIPSIFVCGDGFRLGIWIYNQRYKFEKNQLLPEEIEKLNQIEMIWNISAYFWNLNYQDCKVYFEEHGNIDIPADFKGKSGIFLLDWIQECQKEYQKGNFSSEQIEKLFRIGVLSFISEKEKNLFSHLKNFYKTYQHLCVTPKFVCEDGYPLGKRISQIRAKYRRGEISEYFAEMLENIGFYWNYKEQVWMDNYRICRQYREEHGNLQIPPEFKTANGANLKVWLKLNRISYYKGELSPKRARLFEEIGGTEYTLPEKSKFLEVPTEEIQSGLISAEFRTWQNYCMELLKFYKSFHHLSISADVKGADRIPLKFWFISQKNQIKLGRMPEQKILFLKQHQMLDLFQSNI